MGKDAFFHMLQIPPPVNVKESLGCVALPVIIVGIAQTLGKD